MVKRNIDAKIRKVGNSFVITIPMSIVEKFKLKKGKLIEVSFNL